MSRQKVQLGMPQETRTSGYPERLNPAHHESSPASLLPALNQPSPAPMRRWHSLDMSPQQHVSARLDLITLFRKACHCLHAGTGRLETSPWVRLTQWLRTQTSRPWVPHFPALGAPGGSKLLPATTPDILMVNVQPGHQVFKAPRVILM